jgi:hypothetical protein
VVIALSLFMPTPFLPIRQMLDGELRIALQADGGMHLPSNQIAALQSLPTGRLLAAACALHSDLMVARKLQI